MVGESATLDNILQSYRDLGSHVPTIEPYQSMVNEKPEVKKCLAYMYHDLLQFQKRILKLFSGHGWNKTFQTNWKDYQESFTNTLKAFDQHSRILQQLLEKYHNQTSHDMSRRFNNYYQQYQDDRQDLGTHIRQYEEDRIRLLENAKTQEEERKKEKIHAVRRWISAPVDLQSMLHKDFADIRRNYQNTTEWILKDIKVQNWIFMEHPDQPILWINGKKGAGQSYIPLSLLPHCSVSSTNPILIVGKTVLASHIIDYCREQRKDYKTSYFYCREKDPSLDNCLAIYKVLLHQMLNHHEEMLPSCNDKRLKGNNDVLSDTGPAELLIRRFCEADFNQFIVIDGLDEIEAKQRKEVIHFLTGIVNECDKRDAGNIRVLFISHDLADLRKMKCMESTIVLELDPENTQGAIRNFFDKKIEELKEKMPLRDNDLGKIRELVLTRSKGAHSVAVANSPASYLSTRTY